MKRTKLPGNRQRKPRKYNAEMPKRAYRLCLLGVTNSELAIALDVSMQTIEYWIRTKPEFREAVEKGRLEADSKVAAALYKRAVGFKVKEEKPFIVDGELRIVRITKHYPPDVSACQVWLRNRQRHLWTSPNRVEVTGENGGPIKFREFENVTLEDLNDEALDFLVEQALKAMSEGKDDQSDRKKISQN